MDMFEYSYSFSNMVLNLEGKRKLKYNVMLLFLQNVKFTALLFCEETTLAIHILKICSVGCIIDNLRINKHKYRLYNYNDRLSCLTEKSQSTIF